MKKLLIGSLLTLAMAWGISLGDTALEKSHIISHNDQEVQLAKDLPFEYKKTTVLLRRLFFYGVTSKRLY
ncbi:TPA: quorum-sensing peptide PapR [Bacillus cereus]|nr:quorum-sensing peptide PapR [Bacillus cereus]